jgi:hypothetical protein
MSKKEIDKETFFSELKNLIVDYLQNRLELARLATFEKIAKIVGILFSGMILTILLFFSVLFMSIVGGLFFSKLLDSMLLGFTIIAGFYVVLFIVLFIYRKTLIEKYIVNTVIAVLMDEEDEEK